MVMIGSGAIACTKSPFAGMEVTRFFPGEPERELAEVVCSGNTEAIKALSGSPAVVQALGRESMSYVMWAVICDQPESIRALVEAGADPDQVLPMSGYETTALIMAASTNRTDCIRALLAAGARPDFVPPSPDPSVANKSPLYAALERALTSGTWEAFEILFAQEQDFTVSTMHGTVVGSAALSNQFTLVERFLDRGYRHDLVDIAMTIQAKGAPHLLALEQREAARRVWIRLGELGVRLPLRYKDTSVPSQWWPLDPQTGLPNGEAIYSQDRGEWHSVGYWDPTRDVD